MNPSDRLIMDRLAHVLEHLARSSGVPVPQYYSNRFGLIDGDPNSIGIRNSGPQVTCANDGKPQPLLNLQGFSQAEENPGMASVHIMVADVLPLFVPAAEPTQRLLVDLSWQTGNGGGEATVDPAQGSMFTLAGAHAINATARIAASESTAAATPNTPDTTFKNGVGASTLGGSKLVSACVQWGNTISRPAFMSGLRIAAKTGVQTGRQFVPAQAQRMMLLNDLAGPVNIEVDFWRTNAAFAVRPSYNVFYNNIAATPTNAFWTPIVSGTETISVTASADCNVIAIYELWL